MCKGLNNIVLATRQTQRRRARKEIPMAGLLNCSQHQRHDCLLVIVLRSSFAELEKCNWEHCWIRHEFAICIANADATAFFHLGIITRSTVSTVTCRCSPLVLQFCRRTVLTLAAAHWYLLLCYGMGWVPCSCKLPSANRAVAGPTLGVLGALREKEKMNKCYKIYLRILSFDQ